MAKPRKTRARNDPKPDTTTAAPPQSDVAILFLAADERLVTPIADQLAERLSVFFFPRKQEELAGTDGLESMRAPFMDARVVVVFFRRPWGETPWTRVEQVAITDRCLKQGWQSLLFVQLDSTSALPKWLPETHIRFSWEAYGAEQLIGAVKLRVQEHGGLIRQPDALSRAKHVQREAEHLAERHHRFRDRSWIEGTVYTSAQQAMHRAVELALDAGKTMHPQIQAKAGKLVCVMTDGRVSLAAAWKQAIFNTIEDEAFLCAKEFVGPLLLPGQQGYYYLKPRLVREQKFAPELSLAGELRWVQGGKNTLLSSGEIAHQIVIAFLNLVAKMNRGELQPASMW